MADFCADAPGRRAGIAQIMLHDIPAAVEEIRWAKEHGLTGGVLLPGAPPGSGLPPLHDATYYEPLWAVCEELDLPVNHHSGSAAPPAGEEAEDKVVFILGALRASFADIDPVEVQAMLGDNAARTYGFDIAMLRPIADEIGPRVADVAVTLPPQSLPPEAEKCPALVGFGRSKN